MHNHMISNCKNMKYSNLLNTSYNSHNKVIML